MKLALGITIFLAVTVGAFAVALAQNGLVGGIGTGEYVSGGSSGFGIVAGTVGAAPAPPSCSSSLDFTKACNSQYITVI